MAFSARAGRSSRFSNRDWYPVSFITSLKRKQLFQKLVATWRASGMQHVERGPALSVSRNGEAEWWVRPHPTAPVNVVRISVGASGTDFTAPWADFAALIQAADFTLVHGWMMNIGITD